ncbi:MAG TPA: choice-of-anchor D domain-containing protein, partial [Candidatus Sulfotelmatobacter sp.]
NDPTGPHKITVSGEGQTSRLSVVIADSGDFGKVCVGSFVDKPLILNNSSRCALSIAAISSSSAEFLVPEVLFFPLTVGAGDSLPIPFRFEPTSPGNKSATITVTSSDPASPHKIRVSGDAETSRLSLMIADTGHFGKICIGSFKDEPLILNNSSHCPLTISGIASSSAEFLVPQVLSYPLIIAGGNFLPVPIRFRPTSFGFKSAHITVSSSDPASPHTITVEGEVPFGRLTITGSTIFGGVTCCHREQRTVTICNTGDCNLHVNYVGFKRKRRHFRLINNPFPATLPPGSCLNVVIQYKASERVSRSCELVIHSDDPHHPVRCLDVIAYTIWDCCKECCEPEKCCCKEQRKDCCDDEDDDDDRHEEDDDHLA